MANDPGNSTSIAGAMLWPEAVHMFYATNEGVLAWLKEIREGGIA